MLPPDFLTDFKTWAAEKISVAGGVVWKIPTKPVYPIAHLYGMPMTRSAGEAPIWSQRLAYNIWAGSDDQFGDVKDLAAQLCGAFDSIPEMTVIGTSLVHEAHVYGCEEITDPDTGWPGFGVDVRVTAVRA